MSSRNKACDKDVKRDERSEALLEAVCSDKGVGAGVVQEPETGLLIRTTVQYKDRAAGGSGYRTHVQLVTQSVRSIFPFPFYMKQDIAYIGIC